MMNCPRRKNNFVIVMMLCLAFVACKEKPNRVVPEIDPTQPVTVALLERKIQEQFPTKPEKADVEAFLKKLNLDPNYTSHFSVREVDEFLKAKGIRGEDAKLIVNSIPNVRTGNLIGSYHISLVFVFDRKEQFIGHIVYEDYGK